MKQFMILNN